jgi:hypothetical protein
MRKEWYVKTWMPENGNRVTFEQAIVGAPNMAEAKASALRNGLVAAGRNISVRLATDTDRANPWVRKQATR